MLGNWGRENCLIVMEQDIRGGESVAVNCEMDSWTSSKDLESSPAIRFELRLDTGHMIYNEHPTKLYELSE